MLQMPAAAAAPVIETESPIANDDAAPTAPEHVRVCRICLQSDIAMVNDTDEILLMFHDELVCYDTYENEVLNYCNICVHQLRKFYNFRQKCRRAHILLKTKGAEFFEPTYIKNVTQMLPRPSIDFCIPSPHLQVYLSTHTAPDENLPSNENLDSEENSVEINPGLSDYSILIKNPNGDGYFKLENVEKPQSENNAEKLQSKNNASNLKSYIQDFLKHENTYERDYSDGSLVTSPILKRLKEKKSVKRKRIRIKKPKKILTASEKKELRKQRLTQRFKHWVVTLLKRGVLDDIEDLEVKLSEETVGWILDRCPFGTLKHTGLLKAIGSASKIPKLRRILLSLLKRYNPLYEAMFDVIYLDTREKQLEEFDARKHSDQYKEAAVKCEICYQVFELSGLLAFHMKWHEEEGNPSVCDICSMRFTHDAARNKHVSSSHRERFICKLCQFSTYKVLTMRVHYRDHKGLLYKCPDCDKHFTKRHSMRNHFRYTHRLCTTCTFCGKRILSVVKLKKHIETEHSDLSSEVLASTPTEHCSKCAGVFHSIEALQYHATMAHRPSYNDDQKASYFCFSCKIDFDTVQALYEHKRSEEHRDALARSVGKKPPSKARTHRTCPLCHKEILNDHPRSLYEHYRAEHPAAPYRPEPDYQGYLCDQCGISFKLKHVYNDHINSHMGVQPYECSDCGARFTQRSKAYMHLKTHKKHKRSKRAKQVGPPYICDVCNKSLQNQANLNRHKLIHTGEKPYQCPMCEKRFAQTSTMKLHVTTVHLKLPAPYVRHFRSGVPITSKGEPLGPPKGPVPPVSIDILESCVVGPWKNDLPKLKAVLDANVAATQDNEQEMEEFEEENFDTDEEMEDVVEESCDSDYNYK